MNPQHGISRFRPLLLIVILMVSFLGGSAETAAEGEEIWFTILHTNDEHSALIPHSSAVDYDPDGPDPTVGGFARLATAINEIRSKAGEDPVLLFSAGDFISGSPFAWLALEGRATELTLMRAMGYDAVILGNHEIDYGPDLLAEYLAAAGYPEASADLVVLSGNAEIPSGHALDQVGLASTHVFTLPGSGLRVGVFSLLGEHAQSVTTAAGPVRFINPLDFAESAVRDLNDIGVDLIIAITHSGVEEDVALARDVAGIDVIVGGHCHTDLAEPVIEGNTPIVQAGSTGRYLGCLDLAYDRATGTVRLRNEETGRPYLVPIDDSISPDPVVGAEVEAAVIELNALFARSTGGQYDDIYGVVARSDFVVSRKPALSESAYGNLISDAFRWSVEQVTGEEVDFAFQANGQIRGSLRPGVTAAAEGQLSLYDIASTVGLGSGPENTPGYPLISFYLTGDEVRRVLEIGPLLTEIMGDVSYFQWSGLRFTYDPDRSILLWLPIVGLPIPTYRAVRSAERYVGDDLSSGEGDHTPLVWGDEQLYHVVTDFHLASFLPMVGDTLPRLEVQPKDREGNPVADHAELIVYQGDRPLSVWTAVTDYLGAMPEGPGGYPLVSNRYAEPAGRQERVDTFPLIIWPILGLLILGLACYAVLRRRGRRSPSTDRDEPVETVSSGD